MSFKYFNFILLLLENLFLLECKKWKESSKLKKQLLNIKDISQKGKLSKIGKTAGNMNPVPPAVMSCTNMMIGQTNHSRTYAIYGDIDLDTCMEYCNNEYLTSKRCLSYEWHDDFKCYLYVDSIQTIVESAKVIGGPKNCQPTIQKCVSYDSACIMTTTPTRVLGLKVFRSKAKFQCQIECNADNNCLVYSFDKTSSKCSMYCSSNKDCSHRVGVPKSAEKCDQNGSALKPEVGQDLSQGPKAGGPPKQADTGGTPKQTSTGVTGKSTMTVTGSPQQTSTGGPSQQTSTGGPSQQTSTGVPGRGLWGPWSQWASEHCANNCGNGPRIRTRACQQTSSCVGSPKDTSSTCKDTFPPCFVTCQTSHDNTKHHMPTPTVNDCMAACKQFPWCALFSFSISKKYCYLKPTFKGQFIPSADYISGTKC